MVVDSNPGRSPRSAAEWLREFLRLEAAGGLVLVAAAALAMVVANSPLSASYTGLLSVPIEVRVGSFEIAKPLLLWVNDGLMAVFFLLVGLELKREVLDGHLASIRSATLPAFAAIGGMAGPALIYSYVNWGDPVAMRGWAIPSATDIAFALGILSLLGSRVPPALKALLLSIAIFDDLGAIVVIAMFYTANLSVLALAIAGIAVIGLVILNQMRVLRLTGYFILGLVMWVAVLKSGVHATLAGVALAFCIPFDAAPRAARKAPRDVGAAERGSPLLRLEHALHPWVAFGILPIFAFANAGIPLAGLSLADMLQPVPLGIAVGLLVGKVVGVMGMSALAVGVRLSSLPKGLRWVHVFGTSLLCGVGFTMSLFIASLAFEQGGTAYPGLDRLGILLGSITAGAAGYFVLRATLGAKAVSNQGPGGASGVGG